MRTRLKITLLLEFRQIDEMKFVVEIPSEDGILIVGALQHEFAIHALLFKNLAQLALQTILNRNRIHRTIILADVPHFHLQKVPTHKIPRILHELHRRNRRYHLCKEIIALTRSTIKELNRVVFAVG